MLGHQNSEFMKLKQRVLSEIVAQVKGFEERFEGVMDETEGRINKLLLR